MKLHKEMKMKPLCALTAVFCLFLSGLYPGVARAQGEYGEHPADPGDYGESPVESGHEVPDTSPPPETPPPADPHPNSPRSPIEDESSSGIKSTGLWLETKIGIGPGYTLFGALAGFGTFRLPGILVGYKMDKMVVAMGMNLMLHHWKDRNDGPDATITTFGGVLGPVFQFEFANKGPISLYGQGGLGFLFGVRNEKWRNDTDKYRDFGFSINLGLGARYFLHPSFALGVEIGTDMDASWRNDDGDKDMIFAMTIYGALTAAVVW